MQFRMLVSFLAICLLSTVANAGEFFKDCEDIANDSSYRPLQEYIATNSETVELCQRLDDNEFLYTTAYDIFYCKSENGTPLKCDHAFQGQFFPNLEVANRFTGGKGKQYVLFHVQQLSHGIFGEGYHAFFLVPKKVNPRGYMLFMFPNAGAADQNDGSGTCSSPSDRDVITAATPPVEIVNEGQTNVVVRFNQIKTNCKTNEQLSQTLEYTWQSGSFQQTKNQFEKLMTAH